MKLYANDKTISRCNIKNCKKQKGLCIENWFSSSRISFVIAITFMYSWAEELTSIKCCNEQLNRYENAAIIWKTTSGHYVTYI
ncbi:hypothetical protein X975_15557, partial [Stegodyphus mimosarum]